MLRKYICVMIPVFCAVFILSGVISVNDETSFVTSGIAQEVITAQSISNKPFLLEKKNDEVSTELWSLSYSKVYDTLTLCEYVLPSPWSNLLWGAGKMWQFSKNL